MKKFAILASLLAAFAANTAFAHPDHDDAPPPAPLKLELANKKDGAIVYVTSDNQKLSTTGAKGVLTVPTRSGAKDVPLVPVGTNGLETKVATKLQSGNKVKATVTLQDGSVINTELVVK